MLREKIKIWCEHNEMRLWFVGTSSIGFFICALFLLVFRPLVCPQQVSDQWTAYGYQYSYPKYYGSEQRSKIIAKKEISSYSKEGNAQNKYIENFYEIVCGDIKATDIALIFFTYCLVVVGWFAMRNTDETSKRTDRAYLFLTMETKLTKADPNNIFKARNAPCNANSSIHCRFRNYGKTPAIIETIAVNAEIRDTIPSRVELKSIKAGTIVDNMFIGAGEKSFDFGMPYYFSEGNLAEAATGETALYFYGWVGYKDIFGNNHETGFALIYDFSTKTFSQCGNPRELHYYS